MPENIRPNSPLTPYIYTNPLPTYGIPWHKMDHNRHVHEDNQHPPSTLCTTNTLDIPPALCMTRHDIAGLIHRHIVMNLYQTQNSNKLKTTIPVLNSISPPSLKPSNNSIMLQTSTTLENHCQVKTTIILFSQIKKNCVILEISHRKRPFSSDLWLK